MEEILQELMKTTLEKGPQNKQFYSNLSITKPIHDNLEIQSGLGEGIAYLQSRFDPSNGIQSGLYTSRNCAIECDKVYSNFNSAKETITSVLALDLLFNPYDEELIAPCFQSLSSFPTEMQDALQDFIVPSFGLSTFNLFKESQPQLSDAAPQEPRSPRADLDDFDSGNDSPSPTAMGCSQKEAVQFIPDNFPDDINTTAVTLSVLLHQGLLKPKPVESVVRWLISNSFTFTNPQNKEEEEERITLKMFPALNQQGSCVSDPVAVANFLHLMYLLDISHEALLKSCEEFLLLTLNDTIAATSIRSSSQPSSSELLGNTQTRVVMISSDNEQNETTTEEVDVESQEISYSMLHHSPDSLLYFLSRSLAITSLKRRPCHHHFKRELLNLLDIRLGTTVDSCDLAMRILAGVYLGVLNNAGGSGSGDGCKRDNEQRLSMQTLRMNNLLQKEFELLVSLQNMDGSWPADSIVEIGFSDNRTSSANENGGDDNADDSIETKIVGYLGGKELSTVFAIKAISAFVSCKKHGISEEEVEESQSENEDVDVHYLY